MKKQEIFSKPIVQSQLSAEMLTQAWTELNEYKKVTDQDGLVWHLEKRVEWLHSPPPGKWMIHCQYKTEASAEDLLRTHTLDSIEDARLVELINHKKIDMAMKPIVLYVSNFESLETVLSLEMKTVYKKFKLIDLKTIKRRLVFTWIDRQMLFEAGR